MAAVADAVGFASARHFTNRYVEWPGHRPSEYRKTQEQRTARPPA